MKRLGYLIAFAFCVACAAGADPTTTVPPAATTTAASATTDADDSGEGVMVTADDFSFSPASVTISAGESVTWTLGGGAHTTTSGSAPETDGIWNEVVTADAPFTFTFEEPGTYDYFCRFHPDFMTGTVVVEP